MKAALVTTVLGLSGSSSLLLSASLPPAAAAAGAPDLMAAIRADPRLRQFAASVAATPGLEQALSCRAGDDTTIGDDTTEHSENSVECQQYTVFAPTDAAWQSGAWTTPKQKLLHANAGVRLARVVKSHVVKGAMKSSELTAGGGALLPTLEGGEIEMHAEGTLRLADGRGRGRAAVLRGDVHAGNGVLHVVDEAFAPAGTQCPDTVFATVGSKYSRFVTAMGYDQRRGIFTKSLADEKATKPVAVAADDNGGAGGAGQVFWTNDEDYPHGSATSWASGVDYSGQGKHHVVDKLIDPQGIATDPVNKHLYFAEHSGFALSRTGYDGSGKVTLVHKPQNVSFQPSGVAVDQTHGKMFASIEQPNSTGYIAMFNIDGSDEQMLAGPHVVNPYGLCVDDVNEHVYYIIGGHGGQIRCVNYGATPCKNDVLLDIVDYAYNCAVDNSLAPHGGPTNIAFSVADDIYYVSDEGGDYQKLDRVNTSNPLVVPMGVAFGCMGN
jgi:uncharacterized surface protein with fasciclin (FAS1) repeats